MHSRFGRWLVLGVICLHHTHSTCEEDVSTSRTDEQSDQTSLTHWLKIIRMEQLVPELGRLNYNSVEDLDARGLIAKDITFDDADTDEKDDTTADTVEKDLDGFAAGKYMYTSRNVCSTRVSIECIRHTLQRAWSESTSSEGVTRRNLVDKELLQLALDARAKAREALLAFKDEQDAATFSFRLQQSALLQDETFNPNLLAVILFIVVCVVWYVWRIETSVRRSKARLRTWEQSITRAYLDPIMCFAEFDDDDATVGRTESFTVWHMRGNGFNHPCTDDDAFTVSITGPVRISTSVVTTESSRVVKFTTRKAGTYQIRVELLGEPIAGSPFTRTFLAGVVDAPKCKVLQHLITACVNDSSSLQVLTRDQYGNAAEIDDDATFNFVIEDTLTGQTAVHTIMEVFNHDEGGDSDMGCLIHFQMTQRGVYRCAVVYQSSPEANRETVGSRDDYVTVLVLTSAELAETEKNIRSEQSHYEAIQLSPGQHQGKPVQVYIQPSQMFVRISFLGVFVWKIYTMRVLPASDFLVYEGANALENAARDFSQRNASGNLSTTAHEENSIFMLDDRCQPPIVLSTKNRNVIFATYSKFLRDYVGGSHSFARKYLFFQEKLKAVDMNVENETPINLSIKRAEGRALIRNVRDAVAGFPGGDWRRKWKIHFVDEEGIDYGGVSRELFQLLGVAIFDPSNGLFMSFGEDGEAGLVHPNTNTNKEDLDILEFAGKVVGKVLYESAQERNVNVPARFTRSFLAFLLGLRSNYSFFETDDPEYYKRKIRYILEHSVEGLDLTFSEEEKDASGNVKSTPLKDHGRSIAVSNANKLEYLNLLAIHRLENPVREQVKRFLSGLSAVVPDTLISMFDESELEILICGQSDYSAQDMQAATETTGMHRNDPAFLEALEWFWVTVESFTADERRRLLQFVTGSGVLPLGGFASLKPRFNISFTGTKNSLPLSHTCFNQFCLPSYDCMEDLHRALVTAIHEANEGFGMQ